MHYYATFDLGLICLPRPLLCNLGHLWINLAYSPVLQVRRGNMDNLVIILLHCHLNVCCDPSFEPSCREGSDER